MGVCSEFEIGAHRAAPAYGGWLAPFFQILEDAGTGPGNVPPGAMAMLWRTLETMRYEGASAHAIARTEALLIAIYRLQGALRMSGVEGREIAAMLRGSVRTLSRQWLLDTPLACMQPDIMPSRH
ncbi:MAG: hypothetical protein ACSLE1_09430 [Sphingobium sp.]